MADLHAGRTMDNLPEVLTRLSNRLDTLEHRVSLLERPGELLESLPAPAAAAISPAPAAESASFAHAGASFAVIGKAMLGMAGAYLLRAVAESGSFPKLAVVALAIAYAAMWLIWAVHVSLHEPGLPEPLTRPPPPSSSHPCSGSSRCVSTSSHRPQPPPFSPRSSSPRTHSHGSAVSLPSSGSQGSPLRLLQFLC